jgi:DNA repair exonuclease SbcCD nuclease subunit/ABC-type Na+ transport system ATPase subunit NatA
MTFKIAHISDVHIRNYRYHDVYEEVFEHLYNALREEKPDIIINTGDTCHTKLQISPSFVDMTRRFFESLSDIAPHHIILGNHDLNLRNPSKMDAISPIVSSLKHPNLHLHKYSAEVEVAPGIVLNVMSILDEDKWIRPTDQKAVNIALFHGSVAGVKTDTGWVMEHGDINISKFEGFDYAMLGDIHKTFQKLDDEGRVCYPGSLIQQNHGETNDKGFLIWEIDGKDDFSCRHVKLDNPKPFVTIELTPKGRIPRGTNIRHGARLRLVSNNNLSLEALRRAVDVAKHRFKPEIVTFLNRGTGSSSMEEATKTLNQEDLRDIGVQEGLIKEYLKDHQVEEDVLQSVLDLNRKYNTYITENEEVSRNINWALKSAEWDNLFNYGQGNKIDFKKLGGLVGIFGKNYSGKSSLIDQMLYTIYNSTSKNVRKNLDLINQNKESAKGKVTISVGDREYTIERSSEKYTKRLKGKETIEAKTDVEFYSTDLLGEVTTHTGETRNETDKNIRKVFGTLDDFLLTSMASQMGSLAFVNEGSTKRKEILAKFLDLEVFERKFRLAKEDSQETRALLNRLEGRDYRKEIADLGVELEKSRILTEQNKEVCAAHRKDIAQASEEIEATQKNIDSVPAEVIDIRSLRDKIGKAERKVEAYSLENREIEDSLVRNQLTYEKIETFLADYDIGEYVEKDKNIKEKDSELQSILLQIKEEEGVLKTNRKKVNLLSEVPCGSEYSHCKFISDAYSATELVEISERKHEALKGTSTALITEIEELAPEETSRYLSKYNQLLEKKNEVANRISADQINFEKNKTSILQLEISLRDMKKRAMEYEENRESIENLEGLIDHRNRLISFRREKQTNLESCLEDTAGLYRQNGSLEEKLNSLNESYETLQQMRSDYSAYDLLMTCYHSNGISYDIIKRRLPLINVEIAKILTDVVDFEVFIENEEKKLDMFIKHPKYDPRPLELGSGAEKTIAAMAIRLALLTVSSLPKPDIFILDEPGTALDEENMEGFVRILEMVKGYFSTVVLISHLDALKDCVDSQILIEKNEGFAHVSI